MKKQTPIGYRAVALLATTLFTSVFGVPPVEDDVDSLIWTRYDKRLVENYESSDENPGNWTLVDRDQETWTYMFRPDLTDTTNFCCRSYSRVHHPYGDDRPYNLWRVYEWFYAKKAGGLVYPPFRLYRITQLYPTSGGAVITSTNHYDPHWVNVYFEPNRFGDDTILGDLGELRNDKTTRITGSAYDWHMEESTYSISYECKADLEEFTGSDVYVRTYSHRIVPLVNVEGESQPYGTVTTNVLADTDGPFVGGTTATLTILPALTSNGTNDYTLYFGFDLKGYGPQQ